jgi:lysophospholipase L1-like esterase
MTAEEKENLKHYRGREIDFGEKYAEMIEYAKKALIANNITYININNEPAYSEINDTLFVDTVHLNAKGHLIIAKILSDYLSKK